MEKSTAPVLPVGGGHAVASYHRDQAAEMLADRDKLEVIPVDPAEERRDRLAAAFARTNRQIAFEKSWPVRQWRRLQGFSETVEDWCDRGPLHLATALVLGAAIIFWGWIIMNISLTENGWGMVFQSWKETFWPF